MCGTVPTDTTIRSHVPTGLDLSSIHYKGNVGGKSKEIVGSVDNINDVGSRGVFSSQPGEGKRIVLKPTERRRSIPFR